jgi:ABC-type phosphate transport system permease subunit
MMEDYYLHVSKSHIARRKIKSKVMLILCYVAAMMAILPLLYIFFYTTMQGASSLNVAFFTELPKPVGELGGGMANAIVGTLILVGLGSVIGIPVGVFAGIYVTEYSKSVLANHNRYICIRSYSNSNEKFLCLRRRVCTRRINDSNNNKNNRRDAETCSTYIT